MSFAKLIRRNLFRKPLRAVLTLLLVTTIFFFVAVLMGILHSFTAVTDEGLNRVGVENAIAVTNRLPLAYEQKRSSTSANGSGSATTIATSATSSATSPSTTAPSPRSSTTTKSIPRSWRRGRPTGAARSSDAS